MILNKLLNTLLFLNIFMVSIGLCCAQPIQEKSILKGKIKIDSTWSSKIYLSYIPTFEDIYSMSADMIIANADINSEGYFEFNLDYLPEEDKLYRLHIVKKTDHKSSLIIGGKHENFLLLIAHKNSVIELEANTLIPPFKKVRFIKNHTNIAFQNIKDIIYEKDSLTSLSNAYKRKFLNDNLKRDLLKIADTSSNALVSLYAIYKSDFEVDFAKNKAFYDSFSQKWKGIKNPYFENFNAKVVEKQSDNFYFEFLIGVFCLLLGFFFGKYISVRKNTIQKLSVQERKIYKALRKGASNKDISEEFSISISTAKSHVSSILSKMNVKSRKELMN